MTTTKPVTPRYESHLKDILRGVDPDLDPSMLPATAQHHISNVNVRGGAAPQRGLRATLGGSAGGAYSGGPGSGPTKGGTAEAEYYRKEVKLIEKRLQMTPGG